jgi:hypothetical protein
MPTIPIVQDWELSADVLDWNFGLQDMALERVQLKLVRRTRRMDEVALHFVQPLTSTVSQLRNKPRYQNDAFLIATQRLWKRVKLVDAL